MYLAAVGDVVRLYNAENYEYHQKYKPSFYVKQKTLRDVAWSHNGKYFGIVVDGSSAVEIAHVAENMKPFEKFEVSDPSAVAFPKHESGCITIGTKSGVLHTVNYINKKVSNSFPSCNAKVTAMDYNPADTTIAAGTVDGKVHLYGIKSGQILRKHELKQPQVISSVKFNNNNKGILGAGCHHGRVTVWNINFGHIETQFSEHRAQCTGLVFSPLNKSLLVSIGFDYAVFIYDMRTKKKMLKAVIPEAGTSVDIYKDGQTLVTGTVGGTVSIFDLRDLRAPIKQWTTHSPCVKVAYQLEPEARATHSSSGQRSSLSRLVHKTDSPKMMAHLNGRQSIDSPVSEGEHGSLDDVFSPISSGETPVAAVPETEFSFMNGVTTSDIPYSAITPASSKKGGVNSLDFSCANSDEFICGLLKELPDKGKGELLAVPMKNISSTASEEERISKSPLDDPKIPDANGHVESEDAVTSIVKKMADEQFSHDDIDDILNKYSITKGLGYELGLSISKDSSIDVSNKEKETEIQPKEVPTSPKKVPTSPVDSAISPASSSSPEKGMKETSNDVKPSEDNAFTAREILKSKEELLNSIKKYIDFKFLEQVDDITRSMSTMHLFNISAHSKQEALLNEVLSLLRKEKEDKCVGTD